MSNTRYQEAKRGAWVGIIANACLAVLKGAAGMMSGSRALIADAANSATDVVSSVAVLFGVRLAHTPPDEEHPYGHGKAETIAAIVVAVLIAGVGLEVGYRSVEAFLEPIKPPGWMAVAAAVFSILAKEILFRYTYRLGKRIDSQAIIANAWDHRSDVFSTLAALLGILGSIVGGYIGVPELVYLDPVAGIGVSIFVLFMAYRLARESIGDALDRVLNAEESRDLLETAAQVNGVIKVDELLARQHGHYVIVDIRIAVDPHITVEEGHRIGKNVKKTLMGKFPHVSNVLVHINPYDSGTT
ncbi:cation diffusion facilitator family transporter [Paenactinomyces guangxiensis]|uniref:Cation transporter n=1 Tax=Paenactinomyces guangxiensis TaxID=1490290 RepID=A0A7W1WTE7_9BACL|nr:cation diffusion facilitator family transporter [Paenactinomyces guangxiensis]MBA4495743.1 cation transporter [Paenactinomyces guangxiensis]MBH8592732.1 cation transporter [Paenactinomyces guangxiensis]